MTDRYAAPKRGDDSATDAWSVPSAGVAEGRDMPPVVDTEPLPRSSGER